MADLAELPNLRWTKLNRPRIAGDVVRRARVRERLQHSLDCPLTLVCAPAGYGKTTLLSDWLADSDHPYAWLSLDENDSDPAVFLSYFVAAIRTAYPEACAYTRDLLRAPESPPGLLITALANDLNALPCEPGRADGRCLILVLDDYHLVRDEAVHALLADLLRHPPRAVHLVLSARQDPPLPLNVLRARGELGEIRMQELRFTPEEIAEFMQQAIESRLDERDISILEERTEGWAAGLRLAALTLVTSGDIYGHLAELPADNRYVMDYLMGEVLSHIPATTQSFLLKTSILDRLSGPLCDAVTGTAAAQWNGQAYLEWLAQENLFTWSVDPHQQWYRYHRLFQRLLRNRLEQQYSPEEIAELHAQASAWFSSNGFVDEAIEHALAAGSITEAARLVEAHRHEAMNQEHWHVLQGWLDLLPPQLVDARPELVIAEAWLLHHRAALADVPAALARAEALMQQTPMAEAVRLGLQGEIDALTSQLIYWTADAERTLAFAQRALVETPISYSYVRGAAWMFAAAALHLRGDQRDAVEALYEGLREDRFHSNTYATRLLVTLCFIYWMTADLRNLLQNASYLLELARERDLPESVGWAHYFLGCAHYQQNSLAAAEGDFAAVVAQHKAAHGIVFPESAFGLASVYQAQGLTEQARAMVESVTKSALEVNSPTVLAEARAFEAHLALNQGRRAEAVRWTTLADHDIRPAPMPLFRAAPFSLVEVLLAQGTPASLEEASHLLARLHELVQATHNTRFLIEALALQALLHDRLHDQTSALAALERALVLAEPGGVIRVFVDLGPPMAALLHQLAAPEVAPEYLNKLLAAFPEVVSRPQGAGQPGLIEPLSARELEVLTLLGERLSNKEIAREMGISPMTVKRHTVNIYQKLLVQGRREAAARAVELGMLSSSSPPQPRVQR